MTQSEIESAKLLYHIKVAIGCVYKDDNIHKKQSTTDLTARQTNSKTEEVSREKQR